MSVRAKFCIIPAIDLMDGRCVRLRQGRRDAVTVYSDDPVAIAKQWVSQGADYLHIVDLDGAFTGRPKNLEIVLQIRNEVQGTIQLGGGLRDKAIISSALAKGIDFVILGTKAVTDSQFLSALVKDHPGRVMVSVDVSAGNVALEGWQETSQLRALDLARQLEEAGIKRIVYTDISRDGMLSGPNLEFLVELLDYTALEVIASGGIKNLGHIKEFIHLNRPNLIGCIIGKALYAKEISLPEALAIVRP